MAAKFLGRNTSNTCTTQADTVSVSATHVKYTCMHNSRESLTNSCYVSLPDVIVDELTNKGRLSNRTVSCQKNLYQLVVVLVKRHGVQS